MLPVDSDRWGSPVDRVVSNLTADAPYRVLHRASLVQQRSDGTVDVVPTDKSSPLPQLSQIPIRTIPGITISELPAGSPLLIGFDDGDLTRPFAALWSMAPLSNCRISFNGGTLPIARQTDEVDMGTFEFSFSPARGLGVADGGSASLMWTPPGGSSPVTITTGSDLTGKITGPKSPDPSPNVLA